MKVTIFEGSAHEYEGFCEANREASRTCPVLPKAKPKYRGRNNNRKVKNGNRTASDASGVSSPYERNESATQGD